MKKLLAAIVCLSVVLALAAWWLHGKGAVSARFYDELEDETDAYIAATFLPGAQNNPVRNELNRMLGESLSDVLSEGERIERARRGLLLIDELERQVDAIGETKDMLESRLLALEAEFTNVPDLFSSDRRTLRERTERLYVIADDIRGLSYRANYHTSQIFERIIDDGGSLTPAHVMSLNEQIPQVEEQFDQRANLYAELESIESELDILYGDLRRSSQGGPLSFFSQ